MIEGTGATCDGQRLRRRNRSSTAVTSTSTALVEKIRRRRSGPTRQARRHRHDVRRRRRRRAGFNSCCGWNPSAGPQVAGRQLGVLTREPPMAASRSTDPSSTTAKGNKGHGTSVFGVLTNQPDAPKRVVDSDAYSHMSFVRTLQDMFQLADPGDEWSYMNRSKYTERFIAAHSTAAGVRRQRRSALRCRASDEPRVRDPGWLRAEERLSGRRRSGRMRISATHGRSSNARPCRALAVWLAVAAALALGDRAIGVTWPNAVARQCGRGRLSAAARSRTADVLRSISVGVRQDRVRHLSRSTACVRASRTVWPFSRVVRG